ncbi:MAG TPA: type II secretion system F family protein [Magnetospirillum sp.]|nr:type II secretion system F family protein [Magnetospirillum sp.]
MMPETSTIVLVVAFVAVLLLVEGAFALARDLFGTRGAMNRRLRLLAWGPFGRLDGMLSRAGLTMTTGRFLCNGVALTLALAIICALVIQLAPWKSLVVAAVLGVVLPLAWVRRRGRQRLHKLSNQLPDGIDMIVRSLRAGHPVATAIGMVAREMPDPIGTEFGLVFDEMTYGLDLREALDNLGHRLPAQDLHYLVVAIRVQYGTGGNLAEVLSGLSRVIRDRMRMKNRILALSAEGRLSATILSALPFVLAAVIFVIKPDYYLGAMADPAFPPLMAFGGVGIAMGIVAMHRIVNFRF